VYVGQMGHGAKRGKGENLMKNQNEGMSQKGVPSQKLGRFICNDGDKGGSRDL